MARTYSPDDAKPDFGFFDKRVAKMMTRAIKLGSLTVVFPTGAAETFGNGDDPKATVRLKDDGATRGVYLDPALQFAELYMDGRMVIEPEELDAFISIAKINGTKSFATAPSVAITLWRVAGRLWRRYIAREKAQRNVAHHYDLDEKLFRLFLDDDLQYSCCLLYTSPSPRDKRQSRMPSSA